MPQRYKVFFNQRFILLANAIKSEEQEAFDLQFTYTNRTELKKLVHLFERSDTLQSMLIVHEDMKALKKAFRSCFRMIKAGGGLIRNEDGKFLFIKRRGVWDLPKGKMEKFENYEQTAVREVSEECNLQQPQILGRHTATYHTYRINGKPILKKTVWFLMQISNSEQPKPQHSEEITEVRWFAIDELDEIRKNTFASIEEVISSALT